MSLLFEYSFIRASEADGRLFPIGPRLGDRVQDAARLWIVGAQAHELPGGALEGGERGVDTLLALQRARTLIEARQSRDVRAARALDLGRGRQRTIRHSFRRPHPRGLAPSLSDEDPAREQGQGGGDL